MIFLFALTFCDAFLKIIENECIHDKKLIKKILKNIFCIFDIEQIMKMAWCIWIVMNVYYKERIWIYYLISFYSKMQPLFCLVPTNLSTQFPSWHELTQRPHNSAISVPDLKWSYFAFKGSEQLELPLNWNRIGPLGIEVNEKIFHSFSIFQYPLSQAAADLQPYGCFIYLRFMFAVISEGYFDFY